MTNFKSPLVSCIICRKLTSEKGIFSHYTTAHTEEGKLRQIENAKLSGKTQRSKVKPRLDYELSPNKCKNCNKDLDFRKRFSTFCTHSCAAIYSNNERGKSDWVFPVTDEFRRNCGIASKNRNRIKSVTKVSSCVICGRFFEGHNKKSCSEECLHKLRSSVSRKNASTRVLRSKDEIALYELCESYFDKVTNNDTSIANGWDADILIHDNKTAILWNGPWHYKEMGFSNHSLKQVQNRDKIKTEEFIKAGWSVIVFEDRYYTPKSAFNFLIGSL